MNIKVLTVLVIFSIFFISTIDCQRRRHHEEDEEEYEEEEEYYPRQHRGQRHHGGGRYYATGGMSNDEVEDKIKRLREQYGGRGGRGAEDARAYRELEGLFNRGRLSDNEKVYYNEDNELGYYEDDGAGNSGGPPSGGPPPPTPRGSFEEEDEFPESQSSQPVKSGRGQVIKFKSFSGFKGSPDHQRRRRRRGGNGR